MQEEAVGELLLQAAVPAVGAEGAGVAAGSPDQGGRHHADVARVLWLEVVVVSGVPGTKVPRGAATLAFHFAACNFGFVSNARLTSGSNFFLTSSGKNGCINHRMCYVTPWRFFLLLLSRTK